MTKKNNQIYESLYTNAKYINYILEEIIEIRKEINKLKEMNNNESISN